ncbi:hypothetical protein glysoja_007838 [Glycine soja]|nr:hypothetical protein glysoja_007838 [Glycine soja]
MSARSAVTRISKSERTSWFTEDSTERNDCQSTAAATPVCFAWWKIRSKEFAALRTTRPHLMDTNAQLWYIIREYISNFEDRGVDAADLISFMLESVFMA